MKNNSKTTPHKSAKGHKLNHETIVKETEGYDKSSVRKDIINLKNDMQEINEALKSLLTKQ